MAGIRMYMLTCGAVRINKHVFTPGRDVGVKIEAPVPCALVVHPSGTVLFDTGCHPDGFDTEKAIARYGGFMKATQILYEQADNVVSQLARFGFQLSDVDIVVNSHLHVDHAGANEFFTQQKIYVQQDELDAVRDPAYAGGYFAVDWDHPVHYEPIAGDFDIFGDGSVVCLATPGHTAGHQSLLVRLPKSGTMVLAADACYMTENYEEGLLPRIAFSPEATLRSYQRLHDLEREEHAVVVLGHDPTFWDTRVRHAPEYYE